MVKVGKVELAIEEMTDFYTRSGTLIANGYTGRIVINEKQGQYYEFEERHIIFENIYLPENERWKFEEKWRSKVDFVEWRSRDKSKVVIIQQLRTVSYADFKETMWYIPVEKIVRR